MKAYRYRFHGKFVTQAKFNSLKNLKGARAYVSRSPITKPERARISEAAKIREAVKREARALEQVKRDFKAALDKDRKALFDRIAAKAAARKSDLTRREKRSELATDARDFARKVRKYAEKHDVDFESAVDRYADEFDDFEDTYGFEGISTMAYYDDADVDYDFDMVDLETEDY